MMLANLKSGIRSWLLGLAGVVAGLTLAAPSAYAQGCAMCANNAAALKPHALAALRSGILILLVPPLLFFVGIFAFAFRRGDPASQDWDAEADRELAVWLRPME